MFFNQIVNTEKKHHCKFLAKYVISCMDGKHHFKNDDFPSNDSTELDYLENIGEFKKLFDEFIDYRL